MPRRPREVQHTRPAACRRRRSLFGRRDLIQLPQHWPAIASAAAAILGGYLHQLAVPDGWAELEGPGGDHADAAKDGRGDVKNALDSARGAADPDGVEGGAAGAAGEEAEGADEQADGADDGVRDVPAAGGVELDGHGGGGVVGEVASRDAEEELVVPSGVGAAVAVDERAELDLRVDPDERVGLKVAAPRRRPHALGGDQADLEEDGFHRRRRRYPRIARNDTEKFPKPARGPSIYRYGRFSEGKFEKC